jgi:hypothetical protein
MRLGLALAVYVALGCGSEPAVLDVAVVGPALAAPQFFHGNCPAGWTVRAELRVAETGGVDVALESMSFRLSDSGSGQELGSAVFDGNGIGESYGPGARLIPGGGERSFPISGLSPGGRRDPSW